MPNILTFQALDNTPIHPLYNMYSPANCLTFQEGRGSKEMLHLSVLLAAVAACYCQVVRPIEDNYMPVVSPDDPLLQSIVLSCGIILNTTNYTTHWTTPTGSTIDVSEIEVAVSAGNNKYQARNGDIIIGIFPQASVLGVMMLTYEDAGRYTCSVNFTDTARTERASFQVTLNVFVEILETDWIVTAGGVASVTCEMHGYIHSDADFQWAQGNETLTLKDSNRYGINVTDGRPMRGQRGETEVGRSRLSTLTIFDARKSDEGTYSCFVAGTNQTASIQLKVMDGQTTQDATVTSSETPQKPSCSSSNLITAIVTACITALVCVLCFALIQVIICLYRSQVCKPAKKTGRVPPYAQVKRRSTMELKDNVLYMSTQSTRNMAE